MGNIVHGKKLMAFVLVGSEYKSVGFCTNHTLSTSAQTVSVAHKDLEDAEGQGSWTAEDVDTYSWSVNAEAFYADEANGMTFADLFNLYAAGTKVTLKFAVANSGTVGADGWTVNTELLTGQAIITALDLNASVSEKASYSVTFTGYGKLSAE